MELLPLFPLQLVVFPGEPLNLHIFEPRYRQLIHECEADPTHITFGIPAYIDGELAEYGTQVSLVRVVSRYEDGELDIETRGLRPFRLIEFVRDIPEKLYSGGIIEYLDCPPEQHGKAPKELIRLYNRFHELIETDSPRSSFADANLSFQLAHEVGLSLEGKVALLAMADERERLARILAHLRKAVSLMESLMMTRKHIRGNGRFLKPEVLDL